MVDEPGILDAAFAEASKRECSVCRSAPGKPCVDSDGKRMRGMHAARLHPTLTDHDHVTEETPPVSIIDAKDRQWVADTVEILAMGALVFTNKAGQHWLAAGAWKEVHING